MPSKRLNPPLPIYTLGERVRIREVRGSPRPPAPWLGKRGRVRGSDAEWTPADAPPARPAARSPRQEPQYLVELEGIAGMQHIPESWLARV